MAVSGSRYKAVAYLGLGAADGVNLLLVLPKVEGGQRTHALGAHQLVSRGAAVSHHLRKGEAAAVCGGGGGGCGEG